MTEDIGQKRSQFEEAKALIDQGETSGKIARPRKVLALLEISRHADWDFEWLEYLVIFNCITRRKPARTHGMLSRIKVMYATRDAGEERFEALSQRVADILYPDSITPHGYVRTFGARDQDEILSSMAAMIREIEALGCPVLLYAGTLLGLVRAGKLIGHDDDVDVAVYLGDVSSDTVAQTWLAFKERLVAAGLLSDAETAGDAVSFRIKTDSVDVDLFPAWSEDGRFSVYPYSLNDLDDEDVFPTKPLPGTEFSIPANEDAFLAQCYGENWRIPDPYFHFSWPQAKKRFDCLFRVSYALKPG